MKKVFILLAVLPILAAGPAMSISVGSGPGPLPTGSGDSSSIPCVMNENANITVSLSGSGDDIDAVSAQIKAKIGEVKTLAGKAHFDTFVVQSTNYNVRSSNYNRHNPVANFAGDNPQEGQYHYSGSIRLSIQPADQALKFMKVLTDKGYHANISVNSYNSGNCPR